MDKKTLRELKGAECTHTPVWALISALWHTTQRPEGHSSGWRAAQPAATARRLRHLCSPTSSLPSLKNKTISDTRKALKKMERKRGRKKIKEEKERRRDIKVNTENRRPGSQTMAAWWLQSLSEERGATSTACGPHTRSARDGKRHASQQWSCSCTHRGRLLKSEATFN